ncbi:MAG: VOC family protein [Rhodospirillales bacterium]|jgi:catechol 2,3-dioxygenase-like lactoylglutathione lyase family enzyme
MANSQILELNHVNIETQDVDRSAKFYSEVLGLESRERPEFDRPGHWMYLGNMPIVHIIEPLPDNKLLTGSKDAAISHFALRIKDYEAMRDHLDKMEIDYAEVHVPGSNRRQLFIDDPDGVFVELIHMPD